MIFDTLHPRSKIWIYINSKAFDIEKKKNIKSSFLNFQEEWKSHGSKIEGEIKFLNNHLMVIGAQYKPEAMCGRAVDAQVRFITTINSEFNLDLLNRTNIAFLESDSIKVHNYNILQSLIRENLINKDSLLVNTFAEINSDETYIPFGSSPLALRILS